ncbi:MAG: 2-oxoglutarate ferredoxin oxidoreductase subunit alpha, partial [Bacteroidota bacterium]|nr:2-oxoglutarate ferredoxin oxidoreductase subunit alpha [Bacteroidota bacterium]
TGNVSYDPENHELMVKARQEKVDRIADFIPDQRLDSGPEKGNLLVLGWGSTYGSIKTAVAELQREGLAVSHAHLRYIRPFPKNLWQIIGNFEEVLIPELNNGQLIRIIRDQYFVDAVGYNKIMGIPFTRSELIRKMRDMLEAQSQRPPKAAGLRQKA